MVQVDIVWSYAFGASFAAAAGHLLKKEDKPFTTKWFVFTLLFLSLLFAPSGIYLLWEHTQWETMQIATCKEDIPAWLVTLFALTNITQGILGFYVSYKLARANRLYESHANWIIAWIIFWFILVCGWDCTGYQRFLYDMSVNNGELWDPGKHMGIKFFYESRVWWTLVVMACFFAPMLLYGYVNFIREGLKSIPSIPKEKHPGLIKILAIIFGTQWVACLILAIIASLIVMKIYAITNSLLFSYIAGILLFSIVAYYLLFRKKMLFHKIMKLLYIVD